MPSLASLGLQVIAELRVRRSQLLADMEGRKLKQEDLEEVAQISSMVAQQLEKRSPHGDASMSNHDSQKGSIVCSLAMIESSCRAWVLAGSCDMISVVIQVHARLVGN